LPKTSAFNASNETLGTGLSYFDISLSIPLLKLPNSSS
jgi:hypothetical protein